MVEHTGDVCHACDRVCTYVSNVKFQVASALHFDLPPTVVMIISGSGTRDSPIAIEDDSEDEVITELCDYSLDYQGDSETPTDDDVLLSPRPGTFLSTIPLFRLPEASARSLEKFKQGAVVVYFFTRGLLTEELCFFLFGVDLLQQARTRKRKWGGTPPQNQDPNGSVTNIQGEPVSLLPPAAIELGLGDGKHETKRQRKLRKKLGRERESAEMVQNIKDKGKQKVAPISSSSSVMDETHHQAAWPPASVAMPSQDPVHPAKRPKHTTRTTSGLVAPMDHMSLTPAPGPTSSTTVDSDDQDPASYIYHHPPQPMDQSTQISPIFANESSYPSYQFDFQTLPLPPPQASYMNPMMQSMQSPLGMDFDPLFPLMCMALSGFPMSMPPMPMTPIPSMMDNDPPPPPLHTQPAPRKSSTSITTATSKLLPPKPQVPPPPPPHTHPPTTTKPNHERPFTIRHIDRPPPTSPPTTPVYIPIGKPDFNNKHGVFPILPSIMLSAQDQQYTPNLERTLVMENVPKHMCNATWLTSWSLSACGVVPAKILLGPRRALLEFREGEEAVEAWASRKLGVDEFGRKVEGREGEWNVFVFWYCPDRGGEVKVLRQWRGARRLSGEVRSAVEVRIRELEEEGEGVEEREEGEGQVVVVDKKVEFRELAERLGFRERLEEVRRTGMEEEEICRWEQREIARIERKRRLGEFSRKQGLKAVCKRKQVEETHKRKVKEEEREGKEEEVRKKRWKGDVEIFIASGSTSMAYPSPSSPTSSPHLNALDSLTAGNLNRASGSNKALGGSATGTAATSLSSVTAFPPPSTAEPSLPTPSTPSTSSSASLPPTARISTSIKSDPQLPTAPTPVTVSSSAVSLFPPTPASAPLPQTQEPPSPATTSSRPTLLSNSGPSSARKRKLGELESAEGPVARAQSVASDMSISSAGDTQRQTTPSRSVVQADNPDWKVGMVEGLRRVGRELLNQSTISSGSSAPVLANELGASANGVSRTTVTTTAASRPHKLPPKPALLPTVVAGPPRPNMLPRSASSEIPRQGSLKVRRGNVRSGLVLPESGTRLPSSSVSTPGLRLPSDGVDTPPSSNRGDTIKPAIPAPLAIVPQKSALKPTPAKNVTPQAVEALKSIMAKPVEERQKFLDGEFEATKALMNQLVKMVGKEERKKITELWKEKIRCVIPRLWLFASSYRGFDFLSFIADPTAGLLMKLPRVSGMTQRSGIHKRRRCGCGCDGPRVQRMSE